MRFLSIFSLLSSIFCLSGCLCVPAGDPPKGPITNVNFSEESLTEEQAVEAMITKLTGAIVKNNISEKKYRLNLIAATRSNRCLSRR